VGGLSARQSHGTFYHERDGASGPAASAAAPVAPTSPPLAALDLDHRWAGEIRDAAERIAALSPSPSPAGAPEIADGPPSPEASPPAAESTLSRALELLREDRIAAALAALPPGGDSDAEVQLLHGVLLASSGDLPGAERAGQAAIALDPLHAGARYLLALCREQAGDDAGAVEHDRAAVYLEPRFAMPHLHLGILARRRGDRAEAARELRIAAALLGEDDGARVTLFGGGLRREVLIDVCRAELKACGGSA
jgi:chemotaxis protein methyltransferase CheR